MNDLLFKYFIKENNFQIIFFFVLVKCLTVKSKKFNSELNLVYRKKETKKCYLNGIVKELSLCKYTTKNPNISLCTLLYS